MDDKPSIISVTEVDAKHSKSNMLVNEFVIEGYNVFGKNVGNSKYRGILVYVEKSMCVSELQLACTEFNECLFVQIKLKNREELIIGTFYRSPNSTLENNANLLSVINHVVSNHSGNKLFLGDFNFGNINWESWTVNEPNQTEDSNFIDMS